MCQNVQNAQNDPQTEVKNNKEKEPAWKGYIRPGSFLGTLFFFFSLVLLDTFTENNVKEIYISTLKDILITMTMFFFTSRGVEKVSDLLKKP